jgi:hypothetical protein
MLPSLLAYFGSVRQTTNSNRSLTQALGDLLDARRPETRCIIATKTKHKQLSRIQELINTRSGRGPLQMHEI